ncbi:UNVERIFIED_CONTAM: hypothetical protein GTU68_014121 [Idotea baltica]|nr:hypothetical protein [Idotea baltica]
MNEILKEDWGTTRSGIPIFKYTLSNNKGVQIGIISYGGIVQSIKVPDAQNNLVDVALGFDSISEYENEHPYFGAIIGRYGNRIAAGKFSIDGVDYNLVQNNGVNHLHGGTIGFDKVVWNAKILDQNRLQLTYRSIDMEEGYPGNLDITVVYQLSDDNELSIAYSANTDKPTHVNLTNHTYFNLNGSGDVLDHDLELRASRYTPVDETLIPIGEKSSVSEGPFDFTTSKKIGLDIDSDHEQIKYGGGYDHNWILDNPSLTEPFAICKSLKTGIVVEAFTTEPGVQFYTGNFLDGTLEGKNGIKYHKRSALCLETQHFPDSPNKPSFPSTLLNPDETYSTKTVYKFSRL